MNFKFLLLLATISINIVPSQGRVEFKGTEMSRGWATELVYVFMIDKKNEYRIGYDNFQRNLTKEAFSEFQQNQVIAESMRNYILSQYTK